MSNPSESSSNAALEREPTQAPPESGPRETLWRYAALVGVAAFATTFAQQRMVGQLPTQALLKDGYHLAKEDVAFFFFWATFAWNLKPVAGILTDAFPLFGTRRRHYMLLGATFAGICWAIMGAFPSNYSILLGASAMMNVAMVFSSTVMGGMMVEAGQAYGAPGRITALRQVVTSIAQVGAPMVGGYLAGKAYGLTAGVAGATVLALAAITFFVQKEAPVTAAAGPVTDLPDRPRYKPGVGVILGLVALAALAVGLFLKEELRNIGISLLALESVLVIILVLAVTPTNHPTIRRAQGQLSQIFESRTLWLAVVMLFLIYTVPGFFTALYYQQKDVLKFDDAFIGQMTSLEGAVGLGAALIYGVACKRFTLRTLFFIGVGMSGFTTFGYLFYDHATAPFVHGLGGFAGVMAELALMDLAVRSTPKGCEALGFALMMSIRNFGISMSDVLGTQIMDSYGVPFNTMVVVNGSTSLVVLAFAFVLPAAVMLRREGEAAAAA